jgi:hypothetical protein
MNENDTTLVAVAGAHSQSDEQQQPTMMVAAMTMVCTLYITSRVVSECVFDTTRLSAWSIQVHLARYSSSCCSG